MVFSRNSGVEWSWWDLKWYRFGKLFECRWLYVCSSSCGFANYSIQGDGDSLEPLGFLAKCVERYWWVDPVWRICEWIVLLMVGEWLSDWFKGKMNVPLNFWWWSHRFKLLIQSPWPSLGNFSPRGTWFVQLAFDGAPSIALSFDLDAPSMSNGSSLCSL